MSKRMIVAATWHQLHLVFAVLHALEAGNSNHATDAARHAVPAAVRRNKAVDSFLLASAILKHHFSLEWLEANLNDRGFLQMIETDQDSL